jgi:hypothetical protein
MNRSSILSTIVIFSLLFQFVAPDISWGGIFEFDDLDDTLKTTGIIIGITAGVVLLVVLIAGTIKDIKGGDEEEVDIWADLRQDHSLGGVYGLLIAPGFLDAQDGDAPQSCGAAEDIPGRMTPVQDGRDPGRGLNPELFRIGGSATVFSASGKASEPEGRPSSFCTVRPL